MKSMRSFVAVVALLITTHALAQSPLYAGGAIGQASVKEFCSGAAGAGIACSDSDTSWRAFAGWQASPHFALEAGYTNLGSVSASSGQNSFTLKASALDLSLVALLPVGNGLAPFGRLGVYSALTDASSNFGFSEGSSNTGLTYGAGLRYDLGARAALRGEWQRFQDVSGGRLGKSDVDTLSLGVLFKF